mgnify:CR=1 FL=1
MVRGFNVRMTSFCPAFQKSLVIEPNKTVSVCCSDITRMLDTKLNDVDSLKDFFYNSEKYKEVRHASETVALKDFAPCVACHRSENGFWSEMDTFKTWRFPNNDPSEVSLKYFEVTTSNICKQSCVMCSPLYSSTHAKLAGKLGSISFMNDEDLKKVFEILPDITHLNLKGGEPFADQNNLKILNELYRVNNKMIEITIISNGNDISDKFKKCLSQFDPNVFDISFSLDGLGKLYEWQRGSPFDKSYDTINTFYEETRIPYSIQNTVTVYTWPTLLETYKEYCESFLGLRRVNSSNIVWDPSCMSPGLYPQNYIDEVVEKIMEFDDKYEGVYHVKSGLDKIKTERKPKVLKAYHNKTNKWNKIRKIKIEDVVPELSMI